MSHAEPAGASPSHEPRRSGPWAAIREAAIVIVAALVLSFLVKTFLAQAFYIPSESMETTLEPGDRVVVSLLTPGPFDLERGDVVVFTDPGGWLPPEVPVQRGAVQGAVVTVLQFVGILPRDAGGHLIKRVIGLPGDKVECCDAQGRLTINGVSIDETPYLYPGNAPSEPPAPKDGTFDITVPPGSMWVMGDHRAASRDSRWNQGSPGGGSVPISAAIGKADVTVWPLTRWSFLSGHHDVFADVPSGASGYGASGPPRPSPVSAGS